MMGDPESPVSPVSPIEGPFEKRRSSYGEPLYHERRESDFGKTLPHNHNLDKPLTEIVKPHKAFKPTPQLYLAFLILVILTMAVALDGTSLSVALP